MANLKETRNRIVSVKSTMQITSAMKMVSAAKLKRAQDAVTQMRPFAEKLQEILSNVSADASDDLQSEYAASREVKKALIVPINSNRGLCGGFNANVVKRTVAAINEHYGNVEVSLFCIGKKASDWFSGREEYNVVKSEIELYNDLTFANVSALAEEIMAEFVAGTYDEVHLVYNQFVNAATQNVMFEKFLPVSATEGEQGASNVDYTFEPEKAEIVLELIPKSLKTQLFKSILDSVASEHGARMTAMHQATDNASNLANDLLLEYNKARQAAITTEILEIVGGAEALAG